MASPISSIPPHLAYALDRAGERSGVDFGYLVQTAIRESSLNPDARAPTSSATGLFQFIESTWLEVLKTEGPRLGYGAVAARIEERAGEFFVSDPATRQEILDLRRDPQIASDLAAAFTRRNGEYLYNKFGRMPSAGELYIAHFLGVHGAERFFAAGLQRPDAPAADLFPRAAAANRAIFYEGGRARTVREVYEVLVARHNAAPPAHAGFLAQQMAQTPPLPSRVEIEAALPAGVSFTSLFSNRAEGAQGTPLTVPEPRALFTGFYADQ